jgi:hypothetical protein
MSHEEEFDRIIRQKAEGQEYPFDEANWDRARAMLDRQRNALMNPAVRNFLLPVTLLLILSLSGLGVYYYWNDSGESGPLPYQEQELAVTEAQKTEEPVVMRERKNIGEQSVKTEKHETKKTLAEFISVKPRVSAPAHEKSAQRGPQGKMTSTPETNDVLQNQPIEKVAVTGQVAAPGQPVVQTVVTKTEDEKPALNPENSVAVVPAREEDRKSVPQNQVQSIENSAEHPSKKENSNTGVASVQISAPSVTSDTPAVEVTPTNRETPVSDAHQEIVPEQLPPLAMTLPVEVNLLEINDLHVVSTKPEPDYYTAKKYKFHYLAAEAGAFYNTGWNSPAGTDGNGLNWYGGIQYGIYLSKKFSLAMGLQLYNVSNISQPYYSFTAKHYDFSSTTTSTVLTAGNLVYACIPVKVEYALSERSKVGLGFSLAYLASASNKIVTTGPADPSGSTTKNNFIYAAYNNYNDLISLSYSYRFSKRFRAQAEGCLGLSDLFANNSSVTNDEKTTGLRLGLQFILFDK